MWYFNQLGAPFPRVVHGLECTKVPWDLQKYPAPSKSGRLPGPRDQYFASQVILMGCQTQNLKAR